MQSLASAQIGLFGAGRLGRAIAERLRARGITSDHLMLCYGGSASTQDALQRSGLASLVRPAAEVARRSDLLLFLVRPQQLHALASYRLRPEALFLSFLAGIPLQGIPLASPCQRVRIMTSAPETLVRGRSIAAVYPAAPPIVRSLLALLGADVSLLARESDVHAFTALGPCLPVAFAAWERLGRRVDEDAVRALADEMAVPGFDSILGWAREAQPRGSADEIDRSLEEAATPGGVTEAIVRGMALGLDLAACLRSGIARSLQLAGG